MTLPGFGPKAFRAQGRVAFFPAVVAACGLFAAAPALADPIGDWRIADGSASVRIRGCGGGALCGAVATAKDPAMVGRPVLLSMKPSGEQWAGVIVDARSGTKYNGYISMRGEQTLKVEGCVLGGVICGGQSWSRLK
ncbi:DUF2147 domain-containing protein [Methylocella sp.]|uniref:DUF2147 domain-containing protein n=1 Tax=Methylocella sp. TaxID=1978226 RepID=UPI0037850CF9